MALYAIADLHLSFGTDKPMDVFRGWQNHTERLETNWRRLVRDDDTVVIAGDLSWGMSLEQALPDLRFLHSLPGRKLLLKGNHDYWWTTRRKMDNFLRDNDLTDITFVHNDAVAVDGRRAVCGTRGWFYDAEEDADKKVLLREVGRLKASCQAAVAAGLQPVVFLHYPPVFGGQVCREMLDALHELGVTRCRYGHVHGEGIRHAFQGEFEGIRLSLISADAVDFCPVLCTDFVEKT